jgi:hypothetical protein
MWKRTVASIVGAIAVLAGLIGCAYTIEGFGDFRNPAVPFRLVAVGELLMCSMALAGLGIGVRLLRFGWSGRNGRDGSWARPVLLGIASFFPGFVFSLPLTVLWARHRWPGDGQSDFAAMEVSVYVGIGAAITCCVVLWRKRNASDRP